MLAWQKNIYLKIERLVLRHVCTCVFHAYAATGGRGPAGPRGRLPHSITFERRRCCGPPGDLSIDPCALEAPEGAATSFATAVSHEVLLKFLRRSGLREDRHALSELINVSPLAPEKT